MRQTKGAIGNLLNRYRAVLKKCHLLNVFGSLAVAGMLVMNGAPAAEASSFANGGQIAEGISEIVADQTVESSQDRYAAVIVTSSNNVSMTSGSNAEATVTYSANSSRVYGFHTASGSSLTLTATDTLSFTVDTTDTPGVSTRIFRAYGDMTFNGNITAVARGTSEAVIGVEAWDGADITFTGGLTNLTAVSSGGRVIGVQNFYDNGTMSNGPAMSVMRFEADQTTIVAHNTSGSSQFTQGLLAYQSSTYFSGDTTISVQGGTNTTYGIDVQCDPGNNFDTTVELAGEQTLIEASASGVVFAVRPSGVPGEINFTGKTATIRATSSSNSAYGIESQYGAHVNARADVAVEVRGATNASGVALLEYGPTNNWYAGNANFEGKLSITATADTGTAYGIINSSIKAASQHTDDGKLTATGTTDVIATSNSGDAYGIYGIGNIVNNTLTGDVSVNVSAPSGSSYGVYAADGAVVSLGSDGTSTSITATGNSSTAIEVANTASAALAGTTSLSADKALAGAGAVTNSGDLTVAKGTVNTYTGTYTQTAGSTNLPVDSALFGGNVDIQKGILSVGTVDTSPASGKTAVLALQSPISVAGTQTIAIGDAASSNGTITLGSGTALVLDSANLGTQAAISGPAGSLITASVADDVVLYVNNASVDTPVTTFDAATVTGFTDWAVSNVVTDSEMLTPWVDANNVVHFGARDASEVFTGLSSDLAPAVTTLYAQSLNDVNATEPGRRFLSRATNSDYLGADKNAAVEQMEGAARIAVAGAVPQMTKMAADSATNAVVNRLGLANPNSGVQAINAQGEFVPEKARGLALWIAPLWQNQRGFGMEAGNLDYGYSANLGGVSLGADYTFENAIRAGLMFHIGGGYAQSQGDLYDTTNSMSFWGIGAYGGWEYNNFAVMADVSYTSTWNNVKQDLDSRMRMGSELEADIQAAAISAGLRAEYKLETSVLDLIPHVGVRYMNIRTWGYDVDSNAGTVLEGDGFTQNIWTFPVGVTVSKDIAMSNGWSFKPSVDFTVIPAAGDIKAKEDVRFTGLPGSYEFETQMMDYLTWQGGVGVEFGNDAVSIGLNYTLQAGQNSTGHGVFGMFRYEF